MLEAAGKQRTIHQWGRSAAVALLLMAAGMVLVACASVPALSSSPPTWARAAATLDENTPSLSAAAHPTSSEPLVTTVPNSPLSQSLAKLSGIRKAVVFSANENPFYSFYAPITSWVWKHRIGFTPVVLLSEDVHSFVRQKIVVCHTNGYRAPSYSICKPHNCPLLVHLPGGRGDTDHSPAHVRAASDGIRAPDRAGPCRRPAL
jgi:hypothetical protein